MRVSAATIIGMLLVGASALALSRGCADVLFRAGGAAGIAAARRLIPGNSSYFDGDLSDSAALRHAVAVNPRLAPVWVELGLQAEATGDIGEAERCLLKAAAASRTYDTNWSLANFYFRRRDEQKFWPWARRAAETSYFTQTALFRLCWQLAADPAAILERAIPARPNMLAQYLAFLLQQDKLDEAEAVARRLLPLSRKTEASLLAQYCSRLLSAGRAAAAVGFWNDACRRRLLPFVPLEPEAGTSLTNGDFASEPGAGGFDWRVGTAEGLSVFAVPSPRALRVSLSGKQPERWVLLEQILPVQAGKAYRLSYWLRAEPAGQTNGIQWRVTGPPGKDELLDAPLGDGDTSWRRQAVGFRVPSGVELVRLALEYRRMPGTARAEADVWLRQLNLAFDEENAAGRQAANRR